MTSKIGAEAADLQAGTRNTTTAGSRGATSQRLLVTIATYNERENLGPLITEIQGFAPQADVLVIDDNSPDGTGKLADEMASADPRIRVLHRPGKLGLGTALLAAMRYSIESNYDLMLNLDADFSHPPRNIPDLLRGMDRHDVMIGSRYVAGGGSEGWPMSRQFLSRSVNMLVRLLLRLRVKDASGAFRCYRVSILRRAQLEKIRSRGYSFQQEVLYRCVQAGARVGETPITFVNRKVGKSKVSLRETVRSLTSLLVLGTRKMLGVDKRE
jgi:dolichol-phosphate mannosyltransferase